MEELMRIIREAVEKGVASGTVDGVEIRVVRGDNSYIVMTRRSGAVEVEFYPLDLSAEELAERVAEQAGLSIPA